MRTFMSLFGYGFFVLAVLGSMDVIDFHVYIGPDATAWHAKNATK